MSTVVATQFPSTQAAETGAGLTNPTNAYSDNASYATALPGKNVTLATKYGTFGFGSIPTTASITKVQIIYEWKASTTASVATARAYSKISGSAGTNRDDATEPAADTVNTYDITSERSWTRANLLDGTFEVVLAAVQGSSSTAVTFSFDYVKVEVTYTVPLALTPATASIALSATQALVAAGFTTGSPKYFRLVSGLGSLSGVYGNNVTYNGSSSATVALVRAESELWDLAYVPGTTSNSDNSVSGVVGQRAIGFPIVTGLNSTMTWTIPSSWHTDAIVGWREESSGQTWRLHGNGDIKFGVTTVSTGFSFTTGDVIEFKQVASSKVELRNVTTSGTPYQWATGHSGLGMKIDLSWGNTATYNPPIQSVPMTNWEYADSTITVGNTRIKDMIGHGIIPFKR